MLFVYFSTVLNFAVPQKLTRQVRNSNTRKLEGSLEEVIRKKDVFMGVSGKAGLKGRGRIASTGRLSKSCK
ncbi:MAG: hypothetical protein WBZ36_10000 [Candidatus Nitrosopolaris sp.]